MVVGFEVVGNVGIHEGVEFPEVKGDGFFGRVGSGFFGVDGELEPELGKLEEFLFLLKSLKSFVGELDNGL